MRPCQPEASGCEREEPPLTKTPSPFLPLLAQPGEDCASLPPGAQLNVSRSSMVGMPYLTDGETEPQGQEVTPKVRWRGRTSWDSNSGPPDSPGLTLEAVLVSYYFTPFEEGKLRLRE